MLPPVEKLSGVLDRFLYLNEENDYAVAEFLCGDGNERVTITGQLPGVQCGETLKLQGNWTQHPKHGRQFKISAFTTELPATVHGIRKYLGSGLVPGIGKTYANKIVDALGTDTFRVLTEESARLRTIPGIGKKRAASIKAAWDEQRLFRELYIFLQTYGVTTHQCVKLIKQYGGEAKAILTNEPYRVAREITGIGFKTADRIAINIGYANDAPPRIDAGILYAIETLEEDGHTAVSQEALIHHTAALLDTGSDLVAARIEHLVESKQLIRHDGAPPLLQQPVLDRAENKIAHTLRRLTAFPSKLPPIKIEPAVEWAQEKSSITFAERQAQALRNALSAKVSILTGGPGTGKTSILRALVQILKAKKVRIHLAAPTGRAAQRLAESTGGFASTIHRLLRYDPAKGGFITNEDHPLPTDFLVIDEASMLDTRLASALLQSVPSEAHLLLVGDTDQLPSVGPGNVLKDIIACSEGNSTIREQIPVTRLDTIFRQKEQSLIVTTAHAINSGDHTPPPSTNNPAEIPAWSDLSFVVADGAEDCAQKIVDLCTQHIPHLWPWINPAQDIQVLAPMHKGQTGVGNLNQMLQSALNHSARAIPFGNTQYRPGDKIIQLRNNYDKNLFNGDIGIIKDIDGVEGTFIAGFDGETHEFDRNDMSDIALAYAISIHKSQGSEYPLVIIPFLKAHFMMLQRNLLYTAITRGKKKVIIVGEPAAYAMAVRNNETRTRSTHLKAAITGVFI